MNIKLELTVEQINVVLAGLGKLPYEAVAPVVATIHQQAIQSQAEQTAGDTDANQTS
jgi:hypothetical protein